MRIFIYLSSAETTAAGRSRCISQIDRAPDQGLLDTLRTPSPGLCPPSGHLPLLSDKKVKVAHTRLPSVAFRS